MGCSRVVSLQAQNAARMTYSVHLYLVPLPVRPNTQLTPPTVAVPAAVAVRWCPSDV